MKRSQYINSYLDAMDARLANGEPLITPGTYLSYRLRGRAKSYMAHYVLALIRSLHTTPGVISVESAGHGVAYRREI